MLVKVVFKDGEIVRSIRGNLLEKKGDFIKIQTLKKIMWINKDTIIKMEKSLKEVKHEEAVKS